MRQGSHSTETDGKTNHVQDDIVSTLGKMIPVIYALERRATQIRDQQEHDCDLAKPFLHDSVSLVDCRITLQQ